MPFNNAENEAMDTKINKDWRSRTIEHIEQ